MGTRGALEGGVRLRGGASVAARERPVVSVVTVTLNAVQQLRRTLDSVRDQSWSGIEHIVVDGGSTDGTLSLLTERDGEIAYWRSEADKGIYDAMNKGLAKSLGEYVIFLNSGDVLQGRVLYPGRDLNRLLPVRTLSFWGRTRYLQLRDLRLGMPYCHQGIVFRNQNLTPYDPSLRISADYEFLLQNVSQAGLRPPCGAGSGFVDFDATGVSNTRVLERDVEAARIVRRHFGNLHWLRFWSRQGPKWVVRRIVAIWRRVYGRRVGRVLR